jgi:hypothetical protein
VSGLVHRLRHDISGHRSGVREAGRCFDAPLYFGVLLHLHNPVRPFQQQTKIKKATERGDLGSSAKVAAMKENPNAASFVSTPTIKTMKPIVRAFGKLCAILASHGKFLTRRTPTRLPENTREGAASESASAMNSGGGRRADFLSALRPYRLGGTRL